MDTPKSSNPPNLPLGERRLTPIVGTVNNNDTQGSAGHTTAVCGTLGEASKQHANTLTQALPGLGEGRGSLSSPRQPLNTPHVEERPVPGAASGGVLSPEQAPTTEPLRLKVGSIGVSNILQPAPTPG
eukprot:Hpha_TRINITY_DN9035_c0_g1::TRINITY_DN9035_c0_g1_i1::g.141817::m.141817